MTVRTKTETVILHVFFGSGVSRESYKLLGPFSFVLILGGGEGGTTLTPPLTTWAQLTALC